MKFEKVMEGLVRFFDAEICPAMNDWQEMAARIAVSRLMANTKTAKELVCSNTFLRTFAVVDAEGEINIEPLLADIKAQVEKKGKIEVVLPVFGTFRFTPDDVDRLKMHMMGGVRQ